MSGPSTALLVANPIEVLLSAAVIRAAEAIQQGYQESAALKEHHEQQRGKLLDQQHNAAVQREQSLQQNLERAELEFSQLLTLSERLGVSEKIQRGRPLANPLDLEAANFLHALQSYNAEIKSIMLTSAAARMDQQAWTDATRNLPEFGAAISTPQPDHDVQRLLTRLAHLDAMPEPIHALVRQLAEQLPKERQELLKNELRRQIQLHLDAIQQQQVQEASALVLRQSLKDLGYQVQEFSDTLFVEGGIVHFRRHEWGDYMVRLRINEQTHTANFNVIRAVRNNSNERSVLDHLAEDRWCAEFPALLKAMEARGLGLNVTRRLEAGEVPVQLVDARQLPTFTDVEQRRSNHTLKTREID
ncbi:hypothetical protein AAKU67_000301 [Oxalobacteraceae bacterium GrIS 2.11]